MTQYKLKTVVLFQHLREGGVLAELLLTPEINTLGSKTESALARLLEAAKVVVGETAAGWLYRRQLVGTPVVETVNLELVPPEKEKRIEGIQPWRQPLPLVFDAVQWMQGESLHVAVIPALNIEVVAASAADLKERIPIEIRMALARCGADRSLSELERFQRTQKVSLQTVELTLEIPSPKAWAKAQDEQQLREKPILGTVAIDMSLQVCEPAFEVDEPVRQLAEAFTARQPRSVLLVGAAGVGKTTIVQELVRKRRDLALGHTPFWATTGSRLVAGQTGFGMWQDRCNRVIKEAAKLRAVLHLGNLVELLQVGRYEGNSQGIATFLKPAISSGELLTIAECTPEQLPIIEREDPGLLQVFESMRVEEPTHQQARAILNRYAQWKSKTGAGIETSGLDMLDRLHRRYATYSAYPGRPIRFIRGLLEDRSRSSESPAITASDVTAAFARETSLPLFMLDENIPLDLAQTRAWFTRHVIGQDGAVDLVTDLLATVKARLNRPGQPIASLLMIGPTGVGKTEMSKALAEYLFGDSGRMVRFDMSEYADAGAVQRLVGGFGFMGSGRGSAGVGEGLLTAKVRQQPFSVLLFDEFEKAHPLFFDLLLQILGDGRLTDAAGRLAGFTNTVVIMTSNLGAEAYQRGRMGFAGASPAESAQSHFAQEVRAFLRPELFNRIDRIVPFAPLNESTILQIARRELELLLRRDGVHVRGLETHLDEAVAHWLAHRGFDARLGARPLKRAIERELVGPLAQAVNEYAQETALTADISVSKERLEVAVRARLGESNQVISVRNSASPGALLATKVAVLRRQSQGLQRCTTWIDFKNRIFRLEHLSLILEKRPKSSNIDNSSLKELPRLRKLLAATQVVIEHIEALEDLVMHSLYRPGVESADGLDTEVSDTVLRWQEMLLTLYCQRFTNADLVTLGLFGDRHSFTAALVKAYHDAAATRGYVVELMRYDVAVIETSLAQRVGAVVRATGASRSSELRLRRRLPAESRSRYPFGRDTGVRVIWREPCTLEQALQPSEHMLGISMRISGKSAFPFFAGETGVHALRRANQQHVCRIDVTQDRLNHYIPPDGVERMDSQADGPKRRIYEARSNLASNSELKERVSWTLERTSETVGRLLNEGLIRELGNMLDT